MIVLLSPAKSLDYESPLLSKRSTKPRFTQDSAELISQLRKLSVGKVGKLMSISDKLAQLNYDRFATWENEFTKENLIKEEKKENIQKPSQSQLTEARLAKLRGFKMI